jgi:hypothetical protein
VSPPPPAQPPPSPVYASFQEAPPTPEAVKDVTAAGQRYLIVSPFDPWHAPAFTWALAPKSRQLTLPHKNLLFAAGDNLEKAVLSMRKAMCCSGISPWPPLRVCHVTSAQRNGLLRLCLVYRGSCCMFALQMAYFTVGNETMAVTNAPAAPVGIMCNVTGVRAAHAQEVIEQLSLP